MGCTRIMTSVTDAPQAEPKATPRLSNFTVRYLTALVFIPFGIIGAFVGGALLALMLAPLAVIGALEFYSLAANRPQQGIARAGILGIMLVIAGFYLSVPVAVGGGLLAAVLGAVIVALLRGYPLPQAVNQAWTTLLGVLYIGVPIGMLVAISNFDRGFLWLVVIFGITWGTDTLAYAGGRVWGRRPLAPKLSPKKTIEGALIGIIGGIVPSLLFLLRADAVTTAAVVMILFGPVVAIVGDLLESAIKRYYQVKDSHLERLNVIPGHGGVLDRIDALLLVSVYCYLFLTLAGIAT